MAEIWKDIEGYEGQYQVSTLGRVRSVERQKGGKNGMYGKFGKEHNRSIPIVQLTMDGKYIRGWDCTRQVERELGFRSNNICSVLRKKTNSSHGYKWMYKSDYDAKNTETA